MKYTFVPATSDKICLPSLISVHENSFDGTVLDCLQTQLIIFKIFISKGLAGNVNFV